MRFLASLLFAVALHGQAVINDFSPTVKGVTIGAMHCYFWAHSPDAASLQIACYDAGVELHNEIVSMISSNVGVFAACNLDASGACALPITFKGLVTWIFQPSQQQPGNIVYQLSGMALPFVGSLIPTETGVF